MTSRETNNFRSIDDFKDTDFKDNDFRSSDDFKGTENTLIYIRSYSSIQVNQKLL